MMYSGVASRRGEGSVGLGGGACAALVAGVITNTLPVRKWGKRT